MGASDSEPKRKKPDLSRIIRLAQVETDERTSAEELKRARDGLPSKPPPVFSATPVYVGIDRATVLGSDKTVDGNVYILRPDGSLAPVTGHDLVELHNSYPNFVRRWK